MLDIAALQWMFLADDGVIVRRRRFIGVLHADPVLCRGVEAVAFNIAWFVPDPLGRWARVPPATTLVPIGYIVIDHDDRQGA